MPHLPTTRAQGGQRDQQYGKQRLHNLPKTQKRQPKKTDPDIEQRVLQLHQKTPTTDASGLPATSPSTPFTSPPTPSDTS